MHKFSIYQHYSGGTLNFLALIEDDFQIFLLCSQEPWQLREET